MKIGVLEYRDEKFIIDVMSKLQGSEFVLFGKTDVPLQKVYDVLIDRLSFQDDFLSAIMKLYSLQGTYVINNPFTNIPDDKTFQIQLCEKMGIPNPKTMLIPPEYNGMDMSGVVKDMEWEGLKFPVVLKPLKGYAWDDVYVINDVHELKNVYNSIKSRKVFILQEYIKPEIYLRCFCINKKDVLFIQYDPGNRAYMVSDLKAIDPIRDKLEKWMIEFNKVLDYDMNTIEWAIRDGQPYMIDGFNEVPEILPTAIPPQYYSWIVEKFVDCVNSKAGKENKIPYHIKSDSAA